MNPFVLLMRRPVASLTFVIALIGGGLFGLNKLRSSVFAPPNTPKFFVYIDPISERANQVKEYVVGKFETYFEEHEEEVHHEEHKIVVTSPQSKDVNLSLQYVCQIHSQRHIEVKALEGGYLEQILVKEGQTVKKGDRLFKIVPTLYQAKANAESAEARLAQLELENTKKLFDTKVVSQRDVLIHEAKLAHAQAKADLAKAELNFTDVIAPFDGIVDHQYEQLGSLIKEGDILTTLSDNSVMWVYFNVPEARYLEYMASRDPQKDDQKVQLKLASGKLFNQLGKIGAIEAKFNNETGNIAFRADFQNPERLLRHGQTGTILLDHVMKDSLVIPQRAAFDVLDKRYVYVVDKDGVAHQREIGVQYEMDDIYVIGKGLEAGDKIVLEGIRQVHDGEKVAEFEFSRPEEVMAALKNRAE